MRVTAAASSGTVAEGVGDGFVERPMPCRFGRQEPPPGTARRLLAERLTEIARHDRQGAADVRSEPRSLCVRARTARERTMTSSRLLEGSNHVFGFGDET